MYALEALHLTKRYGDTLALDDLNLAIAPGEIYCLLGANGAGKSTTLNLFLGFAEPSGGEARVLGEAVDARRPAVRRHLAYIPENVMLYPHLTGRQNLAYLSGLAGHDYAAAELHRLLERAGLPPAAHDRPVSGYSKGMRQKVGVAMAVARRARVLLLDEPTSGLDPLASNEFSGLLQQLSAEGVGVLMATHDLFRAQEVGHRVGIMRAGRLEHEQATSGGTTAALEAAYLRVMQAGATAATAATASSTASTAAL